MRRAWVLVHLFGCNQIYGLDETKIRPGSGLDLDLDGIDDAADPCIASAEDGFEDSDSDSNPNATDPCPHDQGGTDGDGDGIPEICDPFPGVADDRRTCTMTFSNPDLNRRLWIEHGASGEWAFGSGRLSSLAFARSSLVPAADLDTAAEATLDARFFVFRDMSMDMDGEKILRVWLRTLDAADGDLACELRGTATNATLAIVGGGTQYATTPSPFPIASSFRVIATRDASGGVRCTVDNGARVEVRAQPPPATGRFGFYFDSKNSDVTLVVETLAIYERDAIVTP